MNLDLGGGSGHFSLQGFTIVDAVCGTGGVIADLRDTPLPWMDSSVNLIHCSHTLEHLSKPDAIKLLQDCYRMLVPGGILTIAVPDMDVFIEGHLTGDWSSHPAGILRINDMNCCVGDKEPVNELWRHRYMWCWESLAYVLEKTGFVDVEKHGHSDGKYRDLFPGAYNADYSSISLYVDALKPR
jgi:SAM-dependent methyltransferase